MLKEPADIAKRDANEGICGVLVENIACNICGAGIVCRGSENLQDFRPSSSHCKRPGTNCWVARKILLSVIFTVVEMLHVGGFMMFRRTSAFCTGW